MAKNRRTSKSRKLEFHVPVKVSVASLMFDLDNPRSSSEPLSGRSSETVIISQLIEIADIQELVQSIAANGYIDIEPMVVMPNNSKLIVLEGNRRLAAITLLRKPDVARECNFPIPAITNAVKESLEEITVYAVHKREEARDFIGFKHINGPHRWDALAKARFAADWFKSERGEGASLADIARRLGDRHDTVKRLVNGVFVLDQAEKARIFTIADRAPGRAFAFSHLYTALTRQGFQEFLGLPTDWRRSDPKVNPIPKDHLENLKRVLQWLYGSKNDGIAPVVTSQNPHIKWLDEILQKPIARKTMLARNKLSEAYKLVFTPAIQFETALLNAQQNASEALSTIQGFQGDDLSLVEAANVLQRNAQIIVATMEAATKKHRKNKRLHRDFRTLGRRPSGQSGGLARAVSSQLSELMRQSTAFV